MSVRPTPLADTAALAGYDNVDGIIQWFTGGDGAAADATGVDDDTRYGLDLQNAGSGGLTLRAVSGDGSKSFTLNNAGTSFAGGLTVAGGLVVSTGGLTVSTGGISVIGGATISGATLLNGALTVTGTSVFVGAVAFTSTAVFTGVVTFMTDVTLQSGLLSVYGPSNDQSLYLRHNLTSGSYTLGATNSASTPSLMFKNTAGTQTALLTSTGAWTVASTLTVSTGGATVTGSSVFAGSLSVSTGGMSVTGSAVFSSGLSVTTGGVTITAGGASIGTTLTVTAAGGQTLECDASRNVVVGTGSIATNATDGFLYIPSVNGTPSGTPTSKSGYAAIVYNQSSARIFVYQGAWRSVAVT